VLLGEGQDVDGEQGQEAAFLAGLAAEVADDHLDFVVVDLTRSGRSVSRWCWGLGLLGSLRPVPVDEAANLRLDLAGAVGPVGPDGP
jgi:hypothetical protein